MRKGTEEVLVTGATGFVGRHVVRELAGEGYPCVALERRTCDLTDVEALRSFCAGRRFLAVVHLAARIPGIAGDGLEEMIRQNMVATDNVLRAAEEASHFVYVSTLDVYGMPRALPISETSPTDPVTPYAISKLAAEKLVQAHRGANGRPHCILRLSQVYGPGERPIKLIPRTIERVTRGEPPMIFGDGSDLRDWVHVRDVARAVGAALRARATGVLNVATGRSRTVLDAVRAIVAASGRPLEPVARPRPTPRVDFQFNTRRIREALGFCPREDFDAAIRELCAQESAPAATLR